MSVQMIDRQPDTARSRTSKPLQNSEASFADKVLEQRPMAHRLGWHLIRRWGLDLSRNEAASLIDFALCEALSRFDENRGAEFSTYLYYVLKGELKRVRRWNVRAQHCVQLAEEHDGEHDDECFSPIPRVVSPAPSPEAETHHNNVRSLCRAMLEKLTPMQRAVVTETVAGEDNVAGLARKLGYSRGHLSTIKSATLRKLRAEMRHRREDMLWDNDDHPITRKAA